MLSAYRSRWTSKEDIQTIRKKIPDNLKPIIEAGAVGINIEDGEGARELLAKKIEQVRKTADSAGVKLFINARTDVYLNQEGKPETWVEETISRAATYQAAGADGLFVPGITEALDIKTVAEGIKLPLKRNGAARPAVGQGINKAGSPAVKRGRSYLASGLEPCLRPGKDVSSVRRFTRRGCKRHALLAVAGTVRQIRVKRRPSMCTGGRSPCSPTT